MICVPITAHTTDEAIRDIKLASDKADIIELRLDLIENPDIQKLFKVKTKPYIITIRSQDAGGNFTGTDEEKTALFQKAIGLGADYVDIELNFSQLNTILNEKGNTKVIVSYHDFSGTLGNLKEVYQLITSTGCDVVKIATNALSISDNIKIFEILKNKTTETIALCIGEKGLVSRILCLAHGSLVTFASLEQGKESAPGQVTVDEMLNVYKVKNITGQTKVLGLIGNPAKYSKGKIVNNTLFQKHNLDAVFIPFEVDNPKPMIELINYINIQGCSITMPHKQSFIPFLNHFNQEAENMGAINCITKKENQLNGYNTDYVGILNALTNKSNLENKSILILGAGSAARAALAAVKKHTQDITIVNRTEEKAQHLAKSFNVKSAPLTKLNDLNPDLLINATSVGMTPNTDESPVPDDYFQNNKPLVFDIVYTPPLTKLLKQAKEAGCEIVSGVDMYIYQAIHQFKLWLNIDITYNEIKDILVKNDSSCNI